MSGAQARLAAVSLDLDGTIYSIRRMVLRHPATFLRLRPFFRCLHTVRDQLRGQGPAADLRAEQAVLLGRALNIPTDQAADRIEQVIDRQWMAIFDTVAPFPGLLETLNGLVNAGLKLAILSDYPVWPKLGGLGLAHLPFAAIINTEEVGALKPHPAAFQQLAATLELAPEQILHVGDIEANDVDGALAAGMRAARFYDRRRRPATRAAFAFRDWRQFVPLLRWKGWVG